MLRAFLSCFASRPALCPNPRARQHRSRHSTAVSAKRQIDGGRAKNRPVNSLVAAALSIGP